MWRPLHLAHGGIPVMALQCRTAASYLLGKKKGHIMFNLFKSLVSGKAFPRISDLERSYLDASVSRIDLERRQREIDAGLFRKSSFDF
ncbi:hypothetical protein [Rhodobacter sp. SY28-1]|uniref:hypothetical protein n=1 Tax=Rhodobacter sp. SY28-1 TaxID=2562317 RepID=UPI0019803E00|nr:hypothetical protein [Rhodobacter sp. SY28-1]